MMLQYSHNLLLSHVPDRLYRATSKNITPRACLRYSREKKVKLTRVNKETKNALSRERRMCIKENQYHVLAEDDALLVMVKTVYLWYKIIAEYWVQSKLSGMLSEEKYVFE